MGSVATDNVELVKRFLKAQNLEHVGNVDDAIELYESIIEERFDSSGPYDRLLAIYNQRSRWREMARVAEAALAQVKTYEDKRAFYERSRLEAKKSEGRLPRAAPRKRS
jgi:lipopolysaccharide biosynthesis regulator YciM